MGFPSSVQIENHHGFTDFCWCFPCKITDACQLSGYFAMWGFPKIGVPPVIIHFNGMFHYKPSKNGGTPITMETPHV